MKMKEYKVDSWELVWVKYSQKMKAKNKEEAEERADDGDWGDIIQFGDHTKDREIIVEEIKK